MRFRKMSAVTLAAVMVVLNAGSNVYADNVYVENESTEQLANEGYEKNFEGDITIDELEQYHEDVGAEEAKINNDAELTEFLIEDKKNRIESYEYMLKEETDPVALEEMQNTLEILKAELAEYSINSIAESDVLPKKADISTNSATSKYFPNIEDQGSKGSCEFFAMYYYMFSYEANRLNNISSKDIVNCYSPEWGYVQYNNQKTGNIRAALEKFGAVKWNQFKYSTVENDDKSLSEVSEDALLEALKTRLDSPQYIQIDTSNASNNLKPIKEILNNNKPFYVSCYTSWGIKKTHKTNLSDKEEDIIVRMGVSEKKHALTIVGYDDTVFCDVNGNGYIDAGELGAFKVANSWGTAEGNDGYYWVLYDALNNKSKITGFSESQYSTQRRSAFGGIFECFNAKAHRPMLIARLKFEGWNPDKTSVSWGSYTDMKKIDNNIRLLDHKKTNSLDAVRLYDYAEYADTVNELIGDKHFGISVTNNSDAGDSTTHFEGLYCSLIDSKKNIIQGNNKYIGSNRSVPFDTQLKLGDINYDKKITNTDAQAVLNIASGNTSNYSNLQILLADYNRDGKVDLKDSQAVNNVKQ